MMLPLPNMLPFSQQGMAPPSALPNLVPSPLAALAPGSGAPPAAGPLPSVSEGPTNDQEYETRRGGWRTFIDSIKTDPDLRSAMLTMGLGMMQDVPAGQSSLGFAAQQAENSVAYLQNLRSMRERERIDRAKVGLAERQVGVQEKGLTQEASAQADRMTLGKEEIQVRKDVAAQQAKSDDALNLIRQEENRIRDKQVDAMYSSQQKDRDLKNLEIQANIASHGAAVLAEIYKTDKASGAGGAGSSADERMAKNLVPSLRSTQPDLYPTDDAAYLGAVGILQGAQTPTDKRAAIMKTFLDAAVKNAGENLEKFVLTPEIQKELESNTDAIMQMNYPGYLAPGEAPRSGVIDRGGTAPPPSAQAPPPSGAPSQAGAAQPPQVGQSAKFGFGASGTVIEVADGFVKVKTPSGTLRMPIDAYFQNLIP